MENREPDPWFMPRESGASYVPQGYALTVGYVVLLSLSSLLIVKSWGWFIGTAIGLSVLFFVILGTKSPRF